ncbi:MAG: SDR family oxidoreductase [Chloroflexota bacterium]|nr:SDR family oxidoreductase [Chloroflexota bacterium]
MPGKAHVRRVAVVTGGGRGIGRAIALALAEEGVHVHVVARTSQQLEEVVIEMRSRGGSACAVALDVSQAQQVQTALGGREGIRCGVPQVLVNAAGVFGPLARIADGDPDAWVNAVLVNTVGTYLTCRALLDGMLASGWGRIVNVSSAAAQDAPGPLNSAYTTSKMAVNWFTRCLALELRGTRVTANTLHPGEVQTDMWRDIRASAAHMNAEAEGFRQWAALVNRTGGDPPENAAAAVLWLLADAADSISGEFVWIAGSLKRPMRPPIPPPPFVVDCLPSQ